MQHKLGRLSWPVFLAGISLLFVLLGFVLTPLRSAESRPIEPASLPPLNRQPPLVATSNFTIALQPASTPLLSNPVHIANAGDGSNRLFVVEQAGTIRVVANGLVLDPPYLDITNLVACCDERGLLSIAFEPQFTTNGTFYLDYTSSSASNFGATVIARVVVADSQANVANVLSYTPILTITQPEANHNGGQLQFGPHDGYLYIGMGDGGGAGDEHGTIGNGQNPNVLLGKMLRINVRGVPAYTIPSSNPFTQTAGYRPEIWALGLRNPWRFSFDRGTGDLYIGDVGQDCWEEIDYQPAGSLGGENYGWRLMEGFHQFNTANYSDCLQPPNATGVVLPIWAYGHDLGFAVSGGYVYRGQQFPTMRGVYFFADYGSGRIWALEKTGPNTWVNREVQGPGFAIATFGEDEAGELYVADYNLESRIYKIVSASATADLSSSTKTVSGAIAIYGDVLTYTIVLRNTGGAFSNTVRVTDTIPSGLNYLPGSFAASLGVVDESGAPTMKWSGVMSNTPTVTLTYAVTVSTLNTALITNNADIHPGVGLPFTRSADVIVNPHRVYLPLSLKGA